MIDELAPPPAVAQPSLPEAEAERRLRLNRFDLEALMAKGDHRILAGDHPGATPFYALAVRRFDSALPEVRRAKTMADWLAGRFRHALVSGIEAAGFPQSMWPERFCDALAIMFGDRQRSLVTEKFPQIPQLFYYPDLPYVNFVDVEMFPWRIELERHYPELRDEALALLSDTSRFEPYVKRTNVRPQGDVYGLLENSDWSSLYLWIGGEPVAETVARCPKTFEVLNRIVPQFESKGKFPSALFSLLKAGAHIPPHNGMLNVQYICHLPLIVPPKCSFRVGEETVEWQEGRMLAFDDTVEHEARNESDRDRLILLFYVWNPHLSHDERLLVRTVLEVVEAYQ